MENINIAFYLRIGRNTLAISVSRDPEKEVWKFSDLPIRRLGVRYLIEDDSAVHPVHLCSELSKTVRLYLKQNSSMFQELFEARNPG